MDSPLVAMCLGQISILLDGLPHPHQDELFQVQHLEPKPKQSTGKRKRRIMSTDTDTQTHTFRDIFNIAITYPDWSCKRLCSLLCHAQGNCMTIRKHITNQIHFKQVQIYCRTSTLSKGMQRAKLTKVTFPSKTVANQNPRC